MQVTMKKKIVCLLLSLVTLTAALPRVLVAAKSAPNPYHVGDSVFLGKYPQTQVTDAALIAALEKVEGNWHDYPYTAGSGEFGSMRREQYASYKNVKYKGTSYRAVKFTQYRPFYVFNELSGSGSGYQQQNGFETKKTYWFRYDPIEWVVLDPAAGLLISRYVLDAQPFTDSVYREQSVKQTELPDTGDGVSVIFSYQNVCFSDAETRIAANSYRSSYVRKWLNDTFYKTVFSEKQRSYITAKFVAPADSVVSEEGTVTSAPLKKKTPDPVYLLSEEEALNEAYYTTDQWGYRTSLLSASGTDYALCQGLDSYGRGSVGWMLRTPAEDTERVKVFSYDVNEQDAYRTGMGVRPVINVNFGECTAGDVDGDGRVTSADARLALRVSVSLAVLPQAFLCYADANADGKVTSADARLILRYSVSLEDGSSVSRFFAPTQPKEISSSDKQIVSRSSLTVGDSLSLGDAYIYRSGAKHQWKSSNPSVVSVSGDGTVQAKKKGFSCVSLTNGGTRYYYFFNVRTALQKRIYALQEKYPSGYFWNSYPKSKTYPAVTETPCTDHSSGAYSHCIGQCAGFAALLSTEVFGSSAPYKTVSGVGDIKIGDYIRCLPHHSVFVIDKVKKGEITDYDIYRDENVKAYSDTITVAECNWDCRCGIQWGRTINLEGLSFSSDLSYSRY